MISSCTVHPRNRILAVPLTLDQQNTSNLRVRVWVGSSPVPFEQHRMTGKVASKGLCSVTELQAFEKKKGQD